MIKKEGEDTLKLYLNPDFYDIETIRESVESGRLDCTIDIDIKEGYIIRITAKNATIEAYKLANRVLVEMKIKGVV